jgi:hypothetical protein
MVSKKGRYIKGPAVWIHHKIDHIIYSRSHFGYLILSCSIGQDPVPRTFMQKLVQEMYDGWVITT